MKEGDLFLPVAQSKRGAAVEVSRNLARHAPEGSDNGTRSEVGTRRHACGFERIDVGRCDGQKTLTCKHPAAVKSESRLFFLWTVVACIFSLEMGSHDDIWS